MHKGATSNKIEKENQKGTERSNEQIRKIWKTRKVEKGTGEPSSPSSMASGGVKQKAAVEELPSLPHKRTN